MMDLTGIDPGGLMAVPAARMLDRQRDFAEVMATAGRRADAGSGTPEARAREAAEQFVAVSLVQPALEQLRETNGAAPPFAPGEAEKQFRALHDATLAREIVRAAHWPLVDRLARDLLRSGAAPAADSPARVDLLAGSGA